MIRPLVAEDSRGGSPIAEGALLRLHWGARCFAAYRRELWNIRALQAAPVTT